MRGGIAGLRGAAGAGGEMLEPHRPRGDPAGPRRRGRAAAGRPARLSLPCKFQRDKLLINSLGEKAVSFFLLFFLCFYFCMAPSYALGSLTAQQFSLHFNILKKMQITALWPF